MLFSNHLNTPFYVYFLRETKVTSFFKAEACVEKNLASSRTFLSRHIRSYHCYCMKHLRFVTQSGGADGKACSEMGALYRRAGVRPNGTAGVHKFLTERIFSREYSVLARGYGPTAEQHQTDSEET